jgi:hypothetical protein
VDTDRNGESATGCALRFLKAHTVAVLLISTALSLPCFWHQHLVAGDLGSHTYNAWLAQLIELGQAPGLSIAPQRMNIVVDLALKSCGSRLGFEVAEKVVASTCVLIFFWGAFALMSAAARCAPWFLVPAIAMIAYGWTFQMGFLNFCLSLGIGFFALSLFWCGRGIDWLIGSALAGMALVSHPMGFVCLVAVATYITVAERTKGIYRWSVFISVLLAFAAVHFYVVKQFRTQYWDTPFFYAMSGADQLLLFGKRYVVVAIAAVLLGGCAFIWDLRGKREAVERWRFRTALELWAILVFTAAMLPELIQLPQYPIPAGFLISRTTSMTAVMGLCVLANIKSHWWHHVGFCALGVAFFSLLFLDTGALNRMETQASGLVRNLPQGRRVVARIEAPREWRVRFIEHMVDRACIGRCFVFSNYEPASGQFRIRASEGNGIVSASPDDVQAMEVGEYSVRRQDLPITLIYQCDANDWTRLCSKPLIENETELEKTGGRH